MSTEPAPQPFSSAPCKHQTRTETDTSKIERATTNIARRRRSNTSDTNKWIQPPIGSSKVRVEPLPTHKPRPR